MKVKDLIRETQWLPGSSYVDGPLPIVSVFLPTFRRAKSGKFRKAIESVLSQTLTELELIIVDDASTDGSADIIAEFMEKDGRVSCLRHVVNIGLPAISEYEAYSKSRGRYIAFAFDDDEFFPDALEELYKHAQMTPDQVVYGSVGMRIRELGSGTEQFVHLGESISSHNINSWNCISNNAVLVPRFILDDIGLYDPHILMTRLCDWDLWRRISRKYILRYVDVCVGEVGGPATDDSLGKTYALDTWASEEQMRQERDWSLRPENFEEYDIFALPDSAAHCTAIAVREMAVAHGRTRENFDISSSLSGSDDNRKVLVLTGNHDACTSIYFDFLPDEWKSRVRVIRYPGGWPISEIAHASCIVFVRQLDPFFEWIAAAQKMQIPCYYFTDDNLTLLQENKEMNFFEDLSKKTLRNKLKDFSGVLTSTLELQEYFREHLIHSNVDFFPPTFCDLKITTSKVVPVRDRLVIAFAGGSHRLSALRDVMLPAFLKYTESGKTIQLIVGGAGSDFSDEFKKHDFLELVTLPFELNWETALLQISRYSPDILIHAPSESANNKYKTTNVALSADVLDAVLVVPDYMPYSDFKELNNAYVVSSPFSARSWLEVLEGLDFSKFSEMKKNNKKYCNEHFSGVLSCRVLASISKPTTFNGFTTVEGRLKLMSKSHGSHISIAGGDVIKDPQKLLESLEELARLRQAASRSKRLGFLSRKHDLWDNLMPQFAKLKEFSQQAKSGSSEIKLELSKSLHDVPYVEYSINFPAAIKSVLIAFATDGLQDGLVGIELVGATGSIVFNGVASLSGVDLSLPVEFVVDQAAVSSSADYRLRVFARTSHPVYMFELVKYRYAGLKRFPVYPFVEISTV
ncbi:MULTISPECIES: glycosyltransferase family 2 protein [Pseudomonas]|uniref:glycosyltransferase family 2 protein n=1 Tax=Pseudomonas TaxID=286 RepID=UPI001070EC6E|nr:MULTISPECIES: glycosyltransferase family 2 protein [Pseudomonas]QBR33177.1 glycosyltransferase family 2 protein [Pseudomonas sp. S150]UZT91362.1 glycosyltransferase family 2 protein [Pseudomonas koreensis]